MLEAHDDAIGVAHDDDLTSGMALSPSVCPEVEGAMEIDIGQHSPAECFQHFAEVLCAS